MNLKNSGAQSPYNVDFLKSFDILLDMSGNSLERDKNIYETGKVFELRKVITVEDLPRGGVKVGDSSLDGDTATMDFTDHRFTSKDILPGDIVRLDEAGPSQCRIAEVYREGLRIIPARKTRKAQLEEVASFRKDLRLQVASYKQNQV